MLLLKVTHAMVHRCECLLGVHTFLVNKTALLPRESPIENSIYQTNPKIGPGLQVTPGLISECIGDL
jgi:hypothetical protein